jgi:triphosphoribosyl-dephospho-CoA synthetase
MDITEFKSLAGKKGYNNESRKDREKIYSLYGTLKDDGKIDACEKELSEHLLTGFLFQKSDELLSVNDFTAKSLLPELSGEQWAKNITPEDFENLLNIILSRWKSIKDARDARKGMQDSVTDQIAKQTAVRTAFSITQSMGGEITPFVVRDVYKQVRKNFPEITLEEVKNISRDYR